MKLVEENAEELDKHFVGLDLVFLKNSLDFIRAQKKKAHVIFSPFLVNAFEKRAFNHIIGRIEEAKKGKEVDPDEDFSPIFENLIDNEYEFTSLLMEPKVHLRDKLTELFDSKKAGNSLKRISILVSLQQSKKLYESQIKDAMEHNLRLQRNLEK